VEERADPQRHNPDWYRIRYQLAALYLNRASFHEGGPRLAEDLQQALGESTELARVSVDVALTEGAPVRPRRMRWQRAERVQERRDLSDFLRSTIVPSALTLLAGALLVDREQNPPVLRASVELHSYRDVLNALDNDELDPDELVKFVERQAQLAPRVYYNLACYQASRQDVLKAKKWLELALLNTTITERVALLKIIERDTTLTEVIADAEFMETLRTYLPPRS
jgi:hypothetical protein